MGSQRLAFVSISYSRLLAELDFALDIETGCLHIMGFVAR